jgi:hypothetical protein
MFSYDHTNLIKEGDIAIFYESIDLNKQVVIKRGAIY